MANWFVRKGGADTNGGSSASLTPDRSGTDMSVTNASTQVTSASAAFTAGDVGKGICIATVLYRIATYTNATTIQLDRVYAGTTGTLKAWAIGGARLTVNGLTSLAVTSVVQAGDNIYLGSGVYRELITLGASYTGSQVNVIGDVTGQYTGDAPGEVAITNYLTNYTTAPTPTAIITSASRSFWSFSNLSFIFGLSGTVAAWGDGSNLAFTKCSFMQAGGSTASTNAISHTFTTASARNITYDSCFFSAMSAIMSISIPTSTVADYDANVVIKNCVFLGLGSTNTIAISGSGANAFKGGGVYFYNVFLRGQGINTTGTNVSTTFPVKVENSIIVSYTIALAAGALGALVEDYNILIGLSTAPRTNVTAGTHSSSDYSRAVITNIGQEQIWGAAPRPFGSPGAGSGVLGFGSSGNGPTTDLAGLPRPSGGASNNYAAGPYERGNTFTKETTTTHTGTNAISALGPATQDFMVPVDAVSTTISVYVRWDATYAGTKPQMSVLVNGELGVSAATATAVGSSGAWEQLSLTFTPTAKGIVVIRIRSNDTAGNGKCIVDSFAVS